MKQIKVRQCFSFNLSQLLITSTVSSLAILGSIILPTQAQAKKLNLPDINLPNKELTGQELNLEQHKIQNFSPNNHKLKHQQNNSQLLKYSDMNNSENHCLKDKKTRKNCISNTKQYCK